MGREKGRRDGSSRRPMTVYGGREIEEKKRKKCVCGCVWDLAFIFINLSFFSNSLHPSGEERSSDRTTQTHAITGWSHTHLGPTVTLQQGRDASHNRSFAFQEEINTTISEYNHCSKLHLYCTAVRISLGNMSNPREHLNM